MTEHKVFLDSVGSVWLEWTRVDGSWVMRALEGKAEGLGISQGQLGTHWWLQAGVSPQEIRVESAIKVPD